MVILEFDFKSLNDKIVNSASSPSLSQEEKREKQNGRSSSFRLRGFLRERTLLSRFVRDPTVSSFRYKRENCSTRRGLHVGTGFRKFLQTP